jgi:hypothetical protein
MDVCGLSTAGPGRFMPGNDPVSIVQEAGRVLGTVWTGAASLALNDRSASGKSPYRTRYPVYDVLVSDHTSSSVACLPLC